MSSLSCLIKFSSVFMCVADFGSYFLKPYILPIIFVFLGNFSCEATLQNGLGVSTFGRLADELKLKNI